MVQAECHSDDRVIEVDFDATPWFVHASHKELIELARCGFGGDYPADEVAIWMSEEKDDIAEMFTYIRLVNKKRIKNMIGFECYVNRDQALEWIAKNIPTIYKRVEKELKEYAD